MNLITLDKAESTNTELAKMASQAINGTIVRAVDQTSGRGQRGNSWESEAGKNLTFSAFIVPEGILASEQFLISQAVSVAISDVIRRYVHQLEDVAIKWPNDIYVGNQKICGILIENSITGTRIGHSIVGIGINVNQLRFESNAPNPVSMIHFVGSELPLEPLLAEFWNEIDKRLLMLNSDSGRRSLRADYFKNLWRGSGFYPYATPGGEPFEAEIVDIGDDGMLTLRDTDGNTMAFAFKEVQFIL